MAIAFPSRIRPTPRSKHYDSRNPPGSQRATVHDTCNAAADAHKADIHKLTPLNRKPQADIYKLTPTNPTPQI